MKVISLVVYLRLWSNTRLHIVVHNLQRERDALEGNTFDLWNRERCHLPLLSASVELVTHSGLGTPGSSATLLRCGLRDPLFGELHQSGFGVVVRLLDFAAVDDVYDIIDRDRCLQTTSARVSRAAKSDSLRRRSSIL